MIKCPICNKDFNDEALVAMDFIYTIFHYTCISSFQYNIVEIGLFKNIKSILQVDDTNIH
jgi:hypothetical protein